MCVLVRLLALEYGVLLKAFKLRLVVFALDLKYIEFYNILQFCCSRVLELLVSGELSAILSRSASLSDCSLILDYCSHSSF